MHRGGSVEYFQLLEDSFESNINILLYQQSISIINFHTSSQQTIRFEASIGQCRMSLQLLFSKVWGNSDTPLFIIICFVLFCYSNVLLALLPEDI